MGSAYERFDRLHHYDSPMADTDNSGIPQRMPRWWPKAVAVFWAGALGALAFLTSSTG